MFYTVSATIAASSLAVVVSLWSFFRVRAAVRWMSANSKRSVSLARLSSLEADLLAHDDALAKLATTQRRMTSRVAMAERRKAQAASETENAPDMTTEAGRTQARADLERELMQSGRLNARSHMNGA